MELAASVVGELFFKTKVVNTGLVDVKNTLIVLLASGFSRLQVTSPLFSDRKHLGIRPARPHASNDLAECDSDKTKVCCRSAFIPLA